MFEVELSPIELGARSGLSRQPPRAPALRDADYDAKFDATTILYDLFWSHDGREVIGVGPPLANLAGDVLPSLRRSLTRSLLSKFSYKELDRCGEITVRRPAKSIRLDDGLFRQEEARIQPNHHRLFRGRKVAVTQSRDNFLHWLRDWAFFLSVRHGCDALLVYDNGSVDYARADLERILAAVPGIEVVVVVDWPYAYGPQGGARQIWDSNYCQYGMLEHARYRFLATARAVLHGDVDEFVITLGGRSVFDMVGEAPTGYLCFGGRWVDNATHKSPEPSRRRHSDYCYFDPSEGTIPVGKWAVVPGRCPRDAQWRVHNILGMSPDLEASNQVNLRHFRAINTNWKRPRWKPEPLDFSRHVLDEELARWMRIFEDAEPSPVL